MVLTELCFRWIINCKSTYSRQRKQTINSCTSSWTFGGRFHQRMNVWLFHQTFLPLFFARPFGKKINAICGKWCLAKWAEIWWVFSPQMWLYYMLVKLSGKFFCLILCATEFSLGAQRSVKSTLELMMSKTFFYFLRQPYLHSVPRIVALISACAITCACWCLRQPKKPKQFFLKIAPWSYFNLYWWRIKLTN